MAAPHEQEPLATPQANEQPSVVSFETPTDAVKTWAPGVLLPTLNYFRYEELLPEIYFASVDSGDWTMLSATELHVLRTSAAMPDALRSRLVRAHLLLDETNIDEYCRRLASRHFFLNEGPTLHILVVTRRCNLECIYCQAAEGRDRRGQMGVETAEKAIDRALETPARSLIVEFQGGEPLLNFPAVRAAVLRAEERGRALGKRVEFSLITNFTEVVTEDILRFLLGHKVSVCISLDGPREIHDRNRNRAGCYDTLRANIRLYEGVWRELRSEAVVLRALLTTTRHSLAAVAEIVDTYVDCGIDHLAIRPVTPVGRGRGERCDLDYSGAEFLVFWHGVVAEVLRGRELGLDLRESHLELFLQKLFANETGHMDIRSPCGAAIGQIVYDTDGGIFTCDEGRMLDDDRFMIGNVASPLRDALASPKTRAILESSIAEQYYCDYCACKPICGVCPVLHYMDDGDLVGDPLRQRRCSVYGGMLRHILRLFATDGNARRTFAEIVETSWDR